MDMIQHDISPDLGEACLMGLYNAPCHGGAKSAGGIGDLRKYVRINTWLKVDLWVEERLYPCVTHNVSYCGMFVETSRSFLDGQKVFVCIRLNQGEGLFCVDGEIVRNGPHGVGVRLIRD